MASYTILIISLFSIYILLILWGLISSFINPEKYWMDVEGWQYKNPEYHKPSEEALESDRFTGLFFIVFYLILIVIAIYVDPVVEEKRREKEEIKLRKTAAAMTKAIEETRKRERELTEAWEQERRKLSRLLLTLRKLYEAGDYKKAIPVAIEYAQFQKEQLGPDSAIYSKAMYNLGVLYFKLGEREKAEACFKESSRVSGKKWTSLLEGELELR